MYVDDVTKPDFAVLIYPAISLEQDPHRGTRVNLIGKEQEIATRDGKSLDEYRKELREGTMRNKHLARKYSLHYNVTSSTPDTFIALCSDDKTVPACHSIWMYEALLKENVPVEMHIYPSGGHGWGFTTDEFGTDKIGYCRQDFFDSLANFLGRERAK